MVDIKKYARKWRFMISWLGERTVCCNTTINFKLRLRLDINWRGRGRRASERRRRRRGWGSNDTLGQETETGKDRVGY